MIEWRLGMKKRFSEEQIIGFLREADAGLPIKELCRRHGFSEASYYLWRSKFGGLEVSDAKRLKTLEQENARLKKLPDGAHSSYKAGAAPDPETWVDFRRLQRAAHKMFQGFERIRLHLLDSDLHRRSVRP